MLRASGVLVSLLLATVMVLMPWGQSIDVRLLDWQFGVLRQLAPRALKAEVVIVGFDEASTDVLREPLTLWHAHLGKFLQAAASAGASVVGLDVVLPERSFDALVPGNDRALLTGILTARRSTPVILAATVDPAGVTRPIHPPFVAAAGPDAVGYALLSVDADGAVRRFDEHIAIEGAAVPTLAGQMARRLGRPVNAGWIDFAAGEPFRFVALQDVLVWAEAGNPAQLQRVFAGKAVLLGSVLKYEDRHRAAVNLVGWDTLAPNAPGVLLHAQVVRNLLNAGLVQAVPVPLTWVLTLMAMLLWWWALRPAVALALALALVVGGLLASTLALHQGVFLPMASVLLAATASIALRQAVQTAVQLRERMRLRRAFEGYVSPPILQEILSGKLNPTLGGERRYACVMFSDIRGYTTRSEHASPEQTIGFLNSYFESTVPIIHAHGGTVVSFMGDGIMAVFGVPNTLPDPCVAGFEAAVAMLANRDRINAELLARGEAPLQIGIGLHAGEGVAGHIGAAARHEYSVIGDVTNVAARLEGLTKDVGYSLVCSSVVANRVGAHAGLEFLGARAIKGHSPVEIHGFDAVGQAAAATPPPPAVPALPSA